MLKKQEGFVGQRSFVLPNHLLAFNETHPLCRGLYITDIGYYPKASFHLRERTHGCNQYILIYCTSGEGWYTIQNQTYTVTANHFFIIPALSPHQYGASQQDPWSIYWIHFAGTMAAAYTHFVYQDSPVSVPLLATTNLARSQKFYELLAYIEMSYNEDNIVYANIGLGHYLTSFCKTVYHPQQKEQHDPTPISKVIAYMKEHIALTLTLEDLAQVAGMSPSYFSLIFKEKIQSTPIHFFTFLKMQQACQLLENTTLRIKEVAYQLGYQDPYHFSRVFTNIMGLSPRSFRQKKVIE